MDDKPIAKLIGDCLSGSLELETACKQASILGQNPDAIREELDEISSEVTMLRGQDLEYENVAAQICWHAAQKMKSDAIYMTSLFNLARSYLFRGELEEAEKHLNTALELAQKQGNRANIGIILGQQAALYQSRGEEEHALTLYRDSLAIARENEDFINEAASCLGIGQLLIARGQAQITEGCDYIERAVELYRIQGHRAAEYECLKQLANAIYEPDQLPSRIEHLQQAVALSKSLNLDLGEGVQVLSSLASTQVAIGAFEKAEKNYMEGLEIVTNAADTLREGIFAGNLGSLYVTIGKFSKARPLLERALACAEAACDSEGVSFVKQKLAQLPPKTPTAENETVKQRGKSSSKELKQADEHPEVERLIALAHQIDDDRENMEKILESIQPTILPTEIASDIADVLLKKIKEWEQSHPYVAYGLALVLEQWIPEDARPKTIMLLYQALAMFGERSGNVKQTIDAFCVCSELAKKEGETEQYILFATNLATTLRRAGRPMDALKVYSDAIGAITPDVAPSVAAGVLLNAATVFSDLGQHEESVPLSQRAISILNDLPEEVLSLTIATVNLACSFIALGQLQAGEESMFKALRLARKNDIPSQEAVALGHLGLIRVQQGRIGEGLQYLNTAAKQSEVLKDFWNAQHWYRDLGNTYFWTKLPRLAQKYFEKALELSKHVGDRRSEGICLEGLGLCQLEKDLDNGITNLNVAWQIFMETLNPLPAFDVAINLSKAHILKARDLKGTIASISNQWAMPVEPDQVRNPSALDEAEKWLQVAQDITQESKLQVSGSIVGVESQILRLRGQPEQAIELLEQEIAASQNTLEEPSLQANLALLYWKCKDFNNALEHFEIAMSRAEELSQSLLWQEHRLKYRDDFSPTYMWAIKCALDAEQPDQAFLYSERSRLAELRRILGIRKEKEPDLISLADFKEQIEHKKAAVLIMMPQPDSIDLFVIAPGLRNEQQIISVKGWGLIQLAKLWIELGKSYEEVKQPIAAFDPQVRIRWQAKLDEVLPEIGDHLLKPALNLINGLAIDEIIFIPHSILWCFPLHAIPTSESECWLDRFVIRYSPSASDLSEKWKNPNPIPKSLVAFADPLGDLPLANVEVERGATNFRGPVQVFTGKQVTREKVLSLLNVSDWIHFACHASQELDNPYATGLILANVDTKDSSFLNLHEINRDVVLNESATVILSACETGTITPRLSSEMLSIAGGFIYAGAHSVVSTYWKVRDACALLILDKFYNNVYSSERNLPEALRDAQLAVRALNESEVYTTLESILHDSTIEQAGSLLTEFAQRRRDIYPFSAKTDWACFSITI